MGIERSNIIVSLCVKSGLQEMDSHFQFAIYSALTEKWTQCDTVPFVIYSRLCNLFLLLI